ncbi:MAG: photosynthetic complex putative assembly protein PuhB [Lautropia sp.]
MSGAHDDFEPVPGLPEALPPGEHILWQGRPRAWSLARQAFHVNKVGVWFAALAAWHLIEPAADASGAAGVLPVFGWLALQAVVAIGLLLALAWLSAGATLYTLTNRRIVMRIGIALPLTVNVPFRIVEGAFARPLPGGAVDVSFALRDDDRIGWLQLWPHARPWHVRRPQPMLRAVADPAMVGVLREALGSFAPTSPDRAGATPVATAAAGRREPQRVPEGALQS